MPIISNNVSVAANSVSANVLAGELFEYLPNMTVVQVFATGSAAGLRATYSIGGELQLDDGVINANNRAPIIPDDLLLKAGGRRGERQILKFRNTTGGALTANYLLQIG